MIAHFYKNVNGKVTNNQRFCIRIVYPGEKFKFCICYPEQILSLMLETVDKGTINMV